MTAAFEALYVGGFHYSLQTYPRAVTEHSMFPVEMGRATSRTIKMLIAVLDGILDRIYELSFRQQKTKVDFIPLSQ